MVRLDLRPLSVNKCWQGRRFKTPEYKEYEQTVLLLLPKLKIPSGKLALTITFGFSNKASDIDNPLKPLLDILQKAYGFNDKQIYRLNIHKEEVAKGAEYLAFDIVAL